jgi:hypothetical protein
MKELLILSVAAFLAAQVAFPQDAPKPQEVQKLTMPFRNPSQPRKLVVDAVVGSVTVKGYEGQEAIVEMTSRSPGRAPRRAAESPAGMHRIGESTAGLDATEDNNTVKISSGFFAGALDLVIQVPVQTSVSVKTMSGGAITIENVSGEIEANNMNGKVNIINVSGSVVAHSMNGKVTVELSSVMPDKAMSFSTMNGDIDVTLPAGIKANVKMKTDRGDMFTDFDVKLDSTVRAPQVTSGTINGGGPEMQFTTFNGNILIHKR